MKRMFFFRIVPIGLVAMSLLLWIHSYYYLAAAYWVGNRSHAIQSSYGKVYLTQLEWCGVDQECGVMVADLNEAMFTPLTSSILDGGSWRYGGFGFDSYDFVLFHLDPPENRTSWYVAIPWWFITAIWVLISVLAWKRGKSKNPVNAFPVTLMQELVS